MDAADITAAIRTVGFATEDSPRRGGTSFVYPGRALADDKPVAVKVFDAGIEATRFEREARILASVEHPTIAGLIDYGRLPTGNPYLVTEWVDGETLAERLERTGPLDVATVRRVLVDLCDALAHVHRQGIVHRDLSLANVLINEQDRSTLIDFGISRADDLPTLTATNDLVGTTRYLAPELLEGAEPSAASDQYAAAIIGYELLAGVWPFEESNSVGRTFHHHLASEPIPLDERVSHVPGPMASAIARSLSKEPSDRFDSIQGLARGVLAASDTGASKSLGRRLVPVVFGLSVAALMLIAGSRLLATSSDTTAEGNDATSSPTTVWPAGLAGELACNMLSTPGFEGNSLTENFWNDPNDIERARLAPGLGVDGTNAVAIGEDDQFGAYGTVVDIRPNTEYVFAASVFFTERPFAARMSVQWLNSEFQLVEQEPVVADLLPAAPGRAVLEVPSAPPDAAFVVTRLEKDDSGGILIADELVFAERDPACDSLLGVGS